MDTCGNCGASVDVGEICSSCGARASGADSAELPTFVVVDDSSTGSVASEHGTANSIVRPSPGATAGRSRRSRGLLLGVAGLALVVVAMAVGVFVWWQSSTSTAAQEQQASTSLSSVLTDLSGARTTAEMRAVAENAAMQQQEFATQGSDNPRIEAVATAFGAVAQLRSMTPDTLASWPDQRKAIEEAVVRVEAADGRPLDPSEVLGAVDANVAAATKQMGEWQLQTAVYEQERAEALAVVAAYEPEAHAAIDEYADIMRAAADMFEVADEAGSSASLTSISRNLQQTVADRDRARNRFARTTPPDALRQVHDEVEASMTAVRDGINDLNAGVSQALRTCSGSGCTLSRVPAYATFSRVATGNTGRFNEAVEAWDAAVTSYAEQIDGMQPPVKPDV